MTAIADEQGKVHIAVELNGVSVTFAINGDGGVAFLPGQEVTIDDARLASVTQQLLASFGAESVPITESA
jgi:hypothetical protein